MRSDVDTDKLRELAARDEDVDLDDMADWDSINS